MPPEETESPFIDELNDLSAVEDARLGELETELLEAAQAAAEERDTDALETIRDAIAAVRTEAETRITAAEEAAARVAELMADIVPEPEITEEPSGDEGDGENSGGDDPPSSEESASTEVETPVAEVVSASTAPAPEPEQPARLQVRRRPRPPASRNPQTDDLTMVIRAGGDVPGMSAGQKMTEEEVCEAWLEKARSIGGGTDDVTPGRFRVARFETNWPRERDLRGLSDVDATNLINAVIAPEAIRAAGGLCPPVTPRYELMTLGTVRRPIVDALPGFRAARGGITFVPPPTLADITSGVDVITEAEDAADATKGCLVATCNPAEEVKVSAIYQCLEVGNFNRIFFPEQFEAFWRLLSIAHARLAENTLWDRMCSLSTAVTSDQVLGTFRDVVGVVARGATAFRSRHRMEPDAVLRFGAPAFLLDMMLVDLYRQMPGDNTPGRARAMIDSAFTDLRVSPFWSLEAGGQVFGAEGGGDLNGWPITVETLLYPEGSFLYLSGGTLDLGTEIRDATLISENNVRAFYESFEEVAFVGPESLCIQMQLCPTGAASELDAVTCGSGS